MNIVLLQLHDMSTSGCLDLGIIRAPPKSVPRYSAGSRNPTCPKHNDHGYNGALTAINRVCFFVPAPFATQSVAKKLDMQRRCPPSVKRKLLYCALHSAIASTCTPSIILAATLALFLNMITNSLELCGRCCTIQRCAAINLPC